MPRTHTPVGFLVDPKQGAIPGSQSGVPSLVGGAKTPPVL
jgi:hypothetical protein